MSALLPGFAASRKEIWQRLSEEIGARFEPGNFFRSDKVQVSFGAWTVTLDTSARQVGKSTQVFTRMRAPYVNPDGFRFTIFRRHLFSGVAKWFGQQDIVVGHEPFDGQFIIQGNDEAKVKALFGGERLRALLVAQPTMHLTVKDDEGWFGSEFPQGVDELYYSAGGVIRDLDRLKLLYGLFAETLEALCRIGSAYKTDPQVSL